jgi:hypothetical protein
MSNWGRRLGKQLQKPIQKKKKVTTNERWNIVKGDMVLLQHFLFDN